MLYVLLDWVSASSRCCAVSTGAALTGVFIVTDFFAAGLNAEKETQWGINAVDAAKEVQT